jgi:hypothetical protein
MKTSHYLFCFLLAGSIGFSQTTIVGTIKDSSTQQVIPFASVGMAGTQQSTLSDKNGYFELTVKQLADFDTLRIFSIGYTGLFVAGNQLKNKPTQQFYLKPMLYDLAAIIVKSKNQGYTTLGTSKYSTSVCTAFIGENNNWRGEQVAIKAINKQDSTVFLESFGFYIIKNEYEDSLQFRIMLYEVNHFGYPGNTFLKRPILFKTNTKQGEVRINLSDYGITTKGDFFISLECLENKMEASKFCFAGSIKVPSFYKTTAFGKWGRVKGGGGDFNVKVSYLKNSKHND